MDLRLMTISVVLQAAILGLGVFWTVTVFAADDLVDPRVLAELRDDCERETRARHEVRGVPGLPGSGFLLDRALNGEARRERKARSALVACIDAGAAGLRAERERESERLADQVIARGQRECAPTDEWRDYCSAPGVPALPLCGAPEPAPQGAARADVGQLDRAHPSRRDDDGFEPVKMDAGDRSDGIDVTPAATSGWDVTEDGWCPPGRSRHQLGSWMFCR